MKATIAQRCSLRYKGISVYLGLGTIRVYNNADIKNVATVWDGFQDGGKVVDWVRFPRTWPHLRTPCQLSDGQRDSNEHWPRPSIEAQRSRFGFSGVEKDLSFTRRGRAAFTSWKVSSLRNTPWLHLPRSSIPNPDVRLNVLEPSGTPTATPRRPHTQTQGTWRPRENLREIIVTACELRQLCGTLQDFPFLVYFYDAPEALSFSRDRH